jgi:hypothetical protein
MRDLRRNPFKTCHPDYLRHWIAYQLRHPCPAGAPSGSRFRIPTDRTKRPGRREFPLMVELRNVLTQLLERATELEPLSGREVP